MISTYLLAALALACGLFGQSLGQPVRSCMEEANEALASLVIPDQVLKLGKAVQAANPETGKASLLELFSDPEIFNIDVKNSSSASEQEWNNMLTVCEQFIDDFAKTVGHIDCGDEILQQISQVSDHAGKLINTIAKYETLARVVGHYGACMSQVDHLNQCLKDASEDMEDLEVSQSIVSLGKAIQAQNPEHSNASLFQLTNGELQNPRVKRLVSRETIGASEQQWADMIEECKSFHDEFYARWQGTLCSENLNALLDPEQPNFLDAIGTFDRLHSLLGYSSACEIHWVASEGEQCLAGAQGVVDDIEIPASVVKFGRDIQDRNPQLKHLSLVQLVADSRADLGIAREAENVDDPQEFEELSAQCEDLWAQYTLSLHNTPCGDDLWKVIDPHVNENFQQMMAKHEKLGQVAGYVKACIDLLRPE